jgi:hypothetical protein
VCSRVSILAVVVASALAVGGCASGKVREANRYVKAVNQAQLSFAASSDRLVTQISPDSRPAQDRVLVGRFSTAVDTFVARLRAIKPPARVTQLHQRLIVAIVAFGHSLRVAGDNLTSKDAGRILDGQQQLGAATARVGRAINGTVAAINRALKS